MVNKLASQLKFKEEYIFLVVSVIERVNMCLPIYRVMLLLDPLQNNNYYDTIYAIIRGPLNGRGGSKGASCPPQEA